MTIHSVRVTQEIEYDSESYLEYCKENEETPTQDGFHEYLQDWINDDFNINYQTHITVL